MVLVFAGWWTGGRGERQNEGRDQTGMVEWDQVR